jgi:hypothetical protein
MVAVAVFAVAFGVAAGSLPSAPASGPSAADEQPAVEGSGGAGTVGSAGGPTENPVTRSMQERVVLALAVVAGGCAFVLAPAYRRELAGSAVVLAVAVASYRTVEPDGSLRGAVGGWVPQTPQVVAVAMAGVVGVVALAVTSRLVSAWRRARDGDGTASRDAGESEHERGGPAPNASVGVHPAARSARNDVHRAWQAAVRDVSLPNPGARTPGEFARSVTGSDDSARHRDDSARHRNDSARHRNDSARHRNDSARHRNDSARHRDESAAGSRRSGVSVERSVRELTAAFRAVRYGGESPDRHRERALALARAVTDGTDGEPSDNGDGGGTASGASRATEGESAGGDGA